MIFNHLKSVDYLKYILENEFFFMQVFEKFSRNYKKIPPDLKFHEYKKNNRIDSLIAFTDNGLFYPHIKEEYINDSTVFIKHHLYDLFSLYGMKEIVTKIYDNLDLSCRNMLEYHVMKLDKNDFSKSDKILPGYECIKCHQSHFNSLKELQHLYHLEEVYNDGTNYPYEAEMKAFKNQLNKRLNYGVIDKKTGKFVSKSYVNAESPNCFQIGGIYTVKEYRGMGLSKYCCSTMIKKAFSNSCKKHILLFVKTKNVPAIKVYKNLGFKNLFDTCLYYF